MDIYQQPEDSAGEDLNDDLCDGDKDDSEEDEDEEGDSGEGKAIRRRREYGAAGSRQTPRSYAGSSGICRFAGRR